MAKPLLEGMMGTRLPTETMKVIKASGEKPSDWLRGAVQLRLEREEQATTTVNRLEKQLATLEQHADSLKESVTGMRKDLTRLHQSDAITQATLADMQKGLGVLEKNQHVLHKMLNDLNQTMRQQFQSLGMSLLTELSQQLQDMAKIEEEPSAFKMKPVPPRTRL